MNEGITANDTVALLLQNQQQIHENIKFADQKAVAFIGINAALLGVMYPLISIQSFINMAFGLTTCFFLAVGIGFSIWVIKPRGKLNRLHGSGVIDSIRISQFTLAQYLSRMNEITDSELVEEIRTFIYDRSIIDREKYRSLKVALPISAIGWFMSLLLAIFVKMSA